MKSILQEASSIERAIDKAWNEAGKPKEFTIKILDQGERNFLGLTRRPAIVSILYKPEKSTYHQQKPRRDRDKNSSSGRTRGRRNENGVRQERSNNGYEVANRSAATSRETSHSSPRRYEDPVSWNSQWKKSVVNSLKDLLKHMGIKTGFTTEVTEERLLTITFKSPLMQEEEEQRMLFASLSYLSIQLLKREYKNRFTGFRIVVTGPAPKAKAAKSEKEAKATTSQQNSSRDDRRKDARRDDKGGRRPRRQRNDNADRRSNSDDQHIDEQLKFAKQQLAQEGDLHEVLEQVTTDSSTEKSATSDRKPARAKKSHSAEQPVAKDEKSSDADTKAAVASTPAAPRKEVKSSKKKPVKHQPFFVLPEEHDADKGA